MTRLVVVSFLLVVQWTLSSFAGEPLSFGIVTDCHYAQIPTRDIRHYQASRMKMDRFVETMTRITPDFIVELGDFKDLGKTPGESLSFLKDIEGSFARFPGARYHVLGNHDMDNLTKHQFLGAVTNTGFTAALPYYSFRVKGWRFLVLDANFRPDDTPYSKGNFHWKQARLSTKELAWLREQLRERIPTIVLIHQLLENEEYVQNADAARKLFEASGVVRAVFQGHLHEGAFSEKNGIPYYTLRALVNGADLQQASFAWVQIDENDSIFVRGFGDAVSCLLTGGGQ